MKIEKLFVAACTGDIEMLKRYYSSGGKPNIRYKKLGKEHSLLAGACRNKEFELVKFLLTVGETLTAEETKIINLGGYT